MESKENFSFQEKSAEKTPSLMDGYLKFNPDFFNARQWDILPQEEKKQREEIAKEYSVLLQNETLKQILDGKKSIGELPKEIGEKLYDLIRCEKKHSSVLSKESNIKKTLEMTGILELKKEQEPYIYNRTASHLFRILMPKDYGRGVYSASDLVERAQNSICESFAKEYLSYVAKSKPKSDKEIRQVMEIIGGEGMDTLLFWTLSPYIHDELKRAGNSVDKSMDKIFQWTKEAGEKVVENQHQSYGGRDFEHVDFWDLGVGEIDFVLGFDERMPSHLLSRLLAKRVAESLDKETK